MNITLEQTCYGCPEQYDARDERGQIVGYLRLRHGFFSAEAYESDGAHVTVYSAQPEGDGVFEPQERKRYLDAAVAAITAHLDPHPADARWESLKEYLETERVSNAAEAREWQHGSLTQAGYASRSIMAGKALAKMTELEAGR